MLEKTNLQENQMNDPPKNWKAYFLDFFMLFLAVSLGFFADNIRENISENAKEKEYIISMIEDAETDKENIREAISLNNLRVLHLDSLAKICINYEVNSTNHADIYRHYMFGLRHPNFVSPTERTMQQLKNAGGMRLIRNKTAADLFILYNDKAKKLADQQLYYGRYQNRYIDFAIQFLNFERFGFDASDTRPTNMEDLNNHFQIMNTDKTKLIEFGNIIFVYQGVVRYYMTILEEMDQQANELIQTLKREYNL